MKSSAHWVERNEVPAVMRFNLLLLGLAAILLISSSAESAVLIGSSSLTGGSAATAGGVMIELTGTIGTIGNNAFEDNNVRVFNEQQNLTLTAPVIFDTVNASLQSQVLGVGSVVSSHYILFDPASSEDAIGVVSFDEPVLGVIRINQRFDDTDAVLGNPSAVYAIGNQQLENGDDVLISGNAVSFEITANSPGDAIRVVTGINPVPGVNICAVGSETMTGIVTGGDSFNNGGVFRQICDPIGDVGDDNFESFDVYGFEEQQSVPLVEDLMLDTTNFVAAGEVVSSYFVVFDPVALDRVVATITFPDDIIGVIDQRDELGLSNFLGDASANYLNPTDLGLETSDSYSVSGNQLSIDFLARTPGDSVRVILGSASPSLTFNVCSPENTTLLGDVTGGSVFGAGSVFNQLCNPIGDVGNDNFQTIDLYAFEERQNFSLQNPIDVDETTPVTIPVGTFISSYYVVFDPGNDQSVVGSIDFPGPILGVMTTAGPMTDSDSFVGNSTAAYQNPSLRGLEGVDVVSVSGNTLSVSFQADTPGDSVRVIVAGTPPVPSVEGFGLIALVVGLSLVTGISFLGSPGLPKPTGRVLPRRPPPARSDPILTSREDHSPP